MREETVIIKEELDIDDTKIKLELDDDDNEPTLELSCGKYNINACLPSHACTWLCLCVCVFVRVWACVARSLITHYTVSYLFNFSNIAAGSLMKIIEEQPNMITVPVHDVKSEDELKFIESFSILEQQQKV